MASFLFGSLQSSLTQLTRLAHEAIADDFEDGENTEQTRESMVPDHTIDQGHFHGPYQGTEQSGTGEWETGTETETGSRSKEELDGLVGELRRENIGWRKKEQINMAELERLKKQNEEYIEVLQLQAAEIRSLREEKVSKSSSAFSQLEDRENWEALRKQNEVKLEECKQKFSEQLQRLERKNEELSSALMKSNDNENRLSKLLTQKEKEIVDLSVFHDLKLSQVVAKMEADYSQLLIENKNLKNDYQLLTAEMLTKNQLLESLDSKLEKVSSDFARREQEMLLTVENVGITSQSSFAEKLSDLGDILHPKEPFSELNHSIENLEVKGANDANAIACSEKELNLLKNSLCKKDAELEILLSAKEKAESQINQMSLDVSAKNIELERLHNELVQLQAEMNRRVDALEERNQFAMQTLHQLKENEKILVQKEKEWIEWNRSSEEYTLQCASILKNNAKAFDYFEEAEIISIGDLLQFLLNMQPFFDRHISNSANLASIHKNLEESFILSENSKFQAVEQREQTIRQLKAQYEGVVKQLGKMQQSAKEAFQKEEVAQLDLAKLRQDLQALQRENTMLQSDIYKANSLGSKAIEADQLSISRLEAEVAEVCHFF